MTNKYRTMTAAQLHTELTSEANKHVPKMIADAIDWLKSVDNRDLDDLGLAKANAAHVLQHLELASFEAEPTRPDPIQYLHEAPADVPLSVYADVDRDDMATWTEQDERDHQETVDSIRRE